MYVSEEACLIAIIALFVAWGICKHASKSKMMARKAMEDV